MEDIFVVAAAAVTFFFAGPPDRPCNRCVEDSKDCCNRPKRSSILGNGSSLSVKFVKAFPQAPACSFSLPFSSLTNRSSNTIKYTSCLAIGRSKYFN